MPKRSKDARLGLGEPLAGKLADFCSANYDCPQINVVREALEEHMSRRLAAEPALASLAPSPLMLPLSLHQSQSRP